MQVGVLTCGVREATRQDFGHVVVPDEIPDSLDEIEAGTLLCPGLGAGSPGIGRTPEGFSCEPLNDVYQSRWAPEDDMVLFQTVGKITSGMYIGFWDFRLNGADPNGGIRRRHRLLQ